MWLVSFLFLAAPHVGGVHRCPLGIGFPAYFIKKVFGFKQSRAQSSYLSSKLTGEVSEVRMREETSKVDSSSK